MNGRWEVIAWDGCGIWTTLPMSTRYAARRWAWLGRNVPMWRCPSDPIGEFRGHAGIKRSWKAVKIYDRKNKKFIT